MSQSEIINDPSKPQSISNTLALEKNIGLDVLRLDLLHPVISGNKWFKLRYYLQDAREKKCKTLITFGGAYSNHIVATAYSAKLHGFKATGIIRGEEPAKYSPTLKDAVEYGMKLRFVSRPEFNDIKNGLSTNEFINGQESQYFIPEGGYGELGMKGASEIIQFPNAIKYSHIITAVGTGCTIAGILHGIQSNQAVIGISVLKGNEPAFDQILSLANNGSDSKFILNHDYHFGGYAKKNQLLIDFMNALYDKEKIPTDFVYTGKLMFGIDDLIRKDFFPPGSQILAIHSGGLQGNRSLQEGTLLY